MLILRRRPGEALLLGDDIEVEVLESSASGVKLGIRAPREVAILRKELKSTAEENRAAAREVSIDAVRSSLQPLFEIDSNNPPPPR